MWWRVTAAARRDFVLVLDLQRSISGFNVGGNLLENQNVLSVLLQTHRVCLYVLRVASNSR